MRSVLLIATLALGVSAFASDDSLVGSYRLELSPDVKATAQKLGMPEPYARILIRQDGTFTYAANTNGNVTGTTGTYELKQGQIRLIASGLFPAQQVKSLNGNAEGNSLVIDGLRYVRASNSANLDVKGTWTVRSNDGREDKSIRMIFNDDKSFKFVGMGATSKGRFEVDGDRLTLVWTEVDGEAVEPGTMRKTIVIREDGSFNIDTYRYMRG